MPCIFNYFCVFIFSFNISRYTFANSSQSNNLYSFLVHTVYISYLEVTFCKYQFKLTLNSFNILEYSPLATAPPPSNNFSRQNHPELYAGAYEMRNKVWQDETQQGLPPPDYPGTPLADVSSSFLLVCRDERSGKNLEESDSASTI